MKEKLSYIDQLSEGLVGIINDILKEVVLEGVSFDSRKKWLQRYFNLENADYATFETCFMQLIEEFGKDNLEMSKIRQLASECYVFPDTIDNLVDSITTRKFQLLKDQLEQEKREAEKKAQEARKEAERIAKKAAEEEKRRQQEKRKAEIAKQEAVRKAREEAERQERERKAREERERKAREEAERQDRERKAREERERKAKEEEERKKKELEERKARIEAEIRAKEARIKELEEKARLKEEQKAREERERRAKEEQVRIAREEAKRKSNAESEISMFFPVDGIILGKTKASDLYLCIKSDYGDKICYGLDCYSKTSLICDRVGHIESITKRKEEDLPAKWTSLGFDWGLSYNQCVSLVCRLGFSIKEILKPNCEHQHGNVYFFSAGFEATSPSGIISILFDFFHNTYCSVDSPNTLQDISIQYLGSFSN